jgi:transposase
MSSSPFLPLPPGLEIATTQVVDDLLRVEVVSIRRTSCCPLCFQLATRIHSRYTRVPADMPCAGLRVQLVLHVRKFFCDTPDCPRKIFTERLPVFVQPWARMTTRLSLAIQEIGLATCGRLGTRLAVRLGIHTSWMTIVRRVMALPPPPQVSVSCLGIDDFAFRRGRTFGTVLVDMQWHQILDLLPDRQKETATAWMRIHPEITQVSRDRGSEYAAAATAGAPQAVQVADRYHIAKNLTEAVQLLLARVLTEMKEASPQEKLEVEQHHGAAPLPVEEWRPAQDERVKRTIATRRAERQDRYQQLVSLREQGLTSQEIAARMAMNERTVRHWFQRGVAPDTRQRRKYQSDFDLYAPYVLTCWHQGHRNGRQIWREIAAQGYPGSERQVYRFLETLKSSEVVPSAGTPCLPHFSSHTAVWLFVREAETLDEAEQEDLASFRIASPSLNRVYQLAQDFLHMLRHREGQRLDAWLTQVAESDLPELRSFAHGVEQDKDAVRAGLTLPINNGQVEGQVTKIKLIKRMMYGRAGFPLLRQRVLHAL